MSTSDANRLFSRAEQAFTAGRIDAARADLQTAQRMAGDHPAILHLLALVEKRSGDLKASRHAFERAIRLAPRDAQILNNHANLLADLGEREAALACYDRALAADPHLVDARYNKAVLLHRMGRARNALAELDSAAATARPSAKLQSALAAILRDLGRSDEAAAAYDAALRLEPARMVALHGRARVAMERGEPDAASFYRRALALKPTDLLLQLGLAEALEAEGEPGAIETLASAVEKSPEWIDGQSALARMRWEAGEGVRFTRSLQAALEAMPENRKLWVAYASALAAADLHQQAAAAAARGRSAAGEDRGLMLLEAVQASEAGDLDRATRLFAALPAEHPNEALHQARHLIRVGDISRADLLINQARSARPWHIQTWAMLGLVWRLQGDPRHEWLHDQPGMVDTSELGLSAVDIGAIAERLRTLHRTRAHPIGQSLRGGTQTRGRLFDRSEGEVVQLRSAVSAAVTAYWNKLPPFDPTHPLLRHRGAGVRFDGSWSVRLTDGGFHVAHIHPNGVLSSACYLVVPDAPPQDGWLEIGGPPDALGLALKPLQLVEPHPGRLALFPSTLYHGTRPFTAGERLTAAFDVVAG